MSSKFRKQRKPKDSGNELSQVVAQSSKPRKSNQIQMTFMPQETEQHFCSIKEKEEEHETSSSPSSRASCSSNSDNEYLNGQIMTVCSSIKPCQSIKKNKKPTNVFEENFDDIIKSIMESKRRSSCSDVLPMRIHHFETNTTSNLTSRANESDETHHETPTNGIKTKKIKTFLKQESIAPIDIIYQHEDELKSMTNTIEISNFYDYTESCMKMIVDISNIKYTSPAKVSFNFDNSGDVKKKLAVFDLDETLVHCLVKDYQTSKNVISVVLPSKSVAKVGVNIRPHWEQALKRIQKKYHIVIYTASHKSYADAVLDFLDPENKFFTYRLYRNNCIMINNDNKVMYVKDCSIFKDYDLKDVVLVDNSVLSFAYNLDNGIPIVPYYDAKQDFEMLFCACYLEHIYSYDDLRVPNREMLRMDNLLKQAIADIEEEKERKKMKKLKAQTPSLKSRQINIKGKVVMPYDNKKESDVATTNKLTFSTLCSDFKSDLKKLRNQFKTEKE